MDIIKQIILNAIPGDEHVYDRIQQAIENYHQRPAHCIAEFKQTSTKVKGDIFEEFCRLYLIHAMNCNPVYLLKDVPEDILRSMKLNRRDYGIDILAHRDGQWFAVQCKWKARQAGVYIPGTRLHSNVVNWKELSTFYALCARSGPWSGHVVMTSCPRVLRMGASNSKDIHITSSNFNQCSKDIWYSIYGQENKVISNVIRPTTEELRQIRINALSK